MMNISKIRYALPLMLVAGVCIVPQLVAQAGRSVQGKVVALKPDGCAAVTEGDIVTFEWDPALDHFTGPLSNFHLVFGKLEDGGIRRRGDRVTLSAIPTRGQGTPVGEGVSAPRNGISQMSFRVYLRGASAGEYDLMEAGPKPAPRTDRRSAPHRP